MNFAKMHRPYALGKQVSPSHMSLQVPLFLQIFFLLIALRLQG